MPELFFRLFMLTCACGKLIKIGSRIPFLDFLSKDIGMSMKIFLLCYRFERDKAPLTIGSCDQIEYLKSYPC